MITLMLSLMISAYASTLKELKNNLSEKNTYLAKLAEKIQHLEKQIGSQNDIYLNNIEASKSMEQRINVLKTEMGEIQSEIANKHKVSFKKLALMQLEDDFDDEATLVIKQKLKNKLNEDMKVIGQLKNESQELNELLTEYQNQIQYFQMNQESLHQLIVDLENQKKNANVEYESLNYDKTELENRITEIKAENKAKEIVIPKKVKIPVEMPIKSFDKYVSSTKGITYHYKNANEVMATQSGTIVYAGELSNYGKVIMIDHGNEIRSIMLGDLDIKVNKGDVVSKGQVIGLANPSTLNNENKTLYFEIRRKNIAQNTYQWLEDNSPTISI